MNDLISRAAAIDAIISETIYPDRETIDKVCGASYSEDNGWVGGIRDAINAVEEVNAVDAVPVVRCRDCRYWRQEVTPTEHWICTQHSFDGRRMQTTPDFYCKDGMVSK